MRIINHGIICHRGRRGDNVSTHPPGTARLNGLWKRDGKFFFMFSVSSMSSVSYSNFVFSAFSMVKSVMGLLLCLFLLSSCYYKTSALDSEELSKKTKDSLTYLYERHYTWNTNLEVVDDSISLECLPIKDTFIQLNRGDRVVVAEFAVHPADSVDSIWVKLAHTQDEQGWIREKELKKSFAPTDSISQAIHLFSDTHASYFVVIFALFVGAYLFRAFRRNETPLLPECLDPEPEEVRRSGELHGEKRLRARGKHGGKPERDERRMKEDACRDPKHRRDPDPLPFRGASRQDIDGIHPREHIEEHSSREEPGVIFNAKHKVGISKE